MYNNSYPKCSTCKKAKKWLDEHNVEYTERHIVENNPTYDELKEWFNKSGLPIKRFFNTSGLLYKEMKLKDKLPTMSEDKQLQLLATNGMLVKRPLIVGENTVLTGFKESEWNEAIKQEYVIMYYSKKQNIPSKKRNAIYKDFMS